MPTASLPPFLRRLIQDPPPEHAFEVSEAGIAHARGVNPPGFLPLVPGATPAVGSRDIAPHPDEFAAAARSLVDGRRRGPAVLVLPDLAVRTAVLPFDQLPAGRADQLGLVRFRLRKAVPFDVEQARVDFQVQAGGGGPVEVVVAAVPLEVLARYEAPFRAAGAPPGVVTTAGLAVLDLLPPGIPTALVAKLSGRALTATVLHGGRVKLVRVLELPEVTADEVLTVLHPTVAYMEDELRVRPDRLHVCGFDAPLAVAVAAELELEAEPLQSRLGTPGEHNAGLLGYLESVGRAA